MCKTYRGDLEVLEKARPAMTNLYSDLDGTLLDTSERYYRLYHDIMTSLGQAVLDKARYWDCKRSRLPELQIFGLTAANGSLFPHYEETRNKLLEDASYLRFDQPVLLHLHQILADLARRHHLYAITLRKKRSLLDEQLKALNLNHYFEATLSPQQAPSPDISSWMLKADLIRDGGWRGETGVIVGDSEADILAGKALGFRTYAVLSGIRKMDFLASLNPDALITDVSELANHTLLRDAAAF